MISEALAQWGPVISTGVMWGAGGLALADGIAMTLDGGRRELFRRELRRGLPWGVGLAAAQLTVIMASRYLTAFELMSQIPWVYLVFALLLPIIWAVGRVRANELQLPIERSGFRFPKRIALVLGLAAFGVILSIAVMYGAHAHTGEAIKRLRSGGASDTAMGVLVIWLMFNAPWQEELVFRHYLIVLLLGRERTKTRLAASIILTSAIFALGHAGHTIPVWPKLAQTFVWGLMFGGLRVWLGTGYAVALHLILNLAAPLVAPFLD